MATTLLEDPERYVAIGAQLRTGGAGAKEITMIREKAIEARPSLAAAGLSDFMTPEALDRLATDLHVVAERLRRADAFRNALARSDPSDEDDRIDYLHT